MENTGFSFLRLRVDDCHHSIQRLGSEWSYIFCELSGLLDNSEIRWVEEFCCSKERNGLGQNTDPELRKYGITEAEKGIKRGKKNKTRKGG